MNHLLYSLITLFIAIFFILLGIIAMILPWSENAKAHAISFIVDHSQVIFFFGLSFLCVGLATCLNIVSSSKRRYYRFKVGNTAVSVDGDLIHKYVKTYLKELFPDNEIPLQLTIKRNTIKLVIDLPSIDDAEKEPLLTRMQEELKKLFSDTLGYQNPFHLSVSFQAPSNDK